MPSPVDERLDQARSRVGVVLKGKYRLDRVLGVGGMASVFAATHRNSKHFAVKMLHPELSHDETLRSRFLREGYLANQVRHPGAVAVMDDDVAEDGSAFLVMELLEGATLDQVWEAQGKKMPLATVASIGHQILQVLIAAHAKGVVHRDIKPTNLFLTYKGRVKVLDFGIARIVDAAAGGNTATGWVMGTPAYMSPEQASGRSADIDARSDLWALGAVLFTLAAGRLVHPGPNAQHILVKAATAPAPSLSSVLPEAPPELAQVIDRSLAFDKAKRWQTADAMQKALAAAARTAYGPAPSRHALAELVGGSYSTPAPAPKGPSAGVILGPTTVRPVAHEGHLGGALRLPRAAILAPGALVLVLVAAVAGRLRGRNDTGRGAPSEAAPEPASVASTAARPVAPPAPATLPGTEPPFVSLDQLPRAQPDLPHPPATVSPSPAPSGPPVRAAAPAPAAPPAPAAQRTPSQTNCDPPYRLDPQGNKRWKLECL